MKDYGVIGLAWANVGASCAQTLILLMQLKNASFWNYLKPSSFFVLSSLIASVGMAGGLFLLQSLVEIDDSQIGNLWKLCLFLPAGVLMQFFFLLAFGFPEARSGARKFRNSFGKLFG